MIWINLKKKKKRINKEENIHKKHLVGLVHWLIKYIPVLIKKALGGVKNKIMVLFKSKDNCKPEPLKTLYGGGKKQSEENIIKSIRNLLKLKKEKEAVKDNIE